MRHREQLVRFWRIVRSRLTNNSKGTILTTATWSIFLVISYRITRSLLFSFCEASFGRPVTKYRKSVTSSGRLSASRSVRCFQTAESACLHCLSVMPITNFCSHLTPSPAIDSATSPDTAFAAAVSLLPPRLSPSLILLMPRPYSALA
jgi:hypothetical protein